MWGYIAGRPDASWRHIVPSLYVRVYRSCRAFWFISASSLIICEGISVRQSNIASRFRFPHYMWGYIGISRTSRIWAKVPSLYVRVYRCRVVLVSYLSRSLIICEGISCLLDLLWLLEVFPHYMWGYICIMKPRAICISVPSLYMSVYRNRQWHPSGLKKYKCSWR